MKRAILYIILVAAALGCSSQITVDSNGLTVGGEITATNTVMINGFDGIEYENGGTWLHLNLGGPLGVSVSAAF